MPVHFVYRSHSDSRGGFYHRRFAADTVLEWFRGIWKGVPAGQAAAHAEKLIGRDVSSFAHLFGRIHQRRLAPPKTMRQLAGCLHEFLSELGTEYGPHRIQLLIEDGEREAAVYMFDDHHTAKHPDRCAFLTRDDWVLPDGMAVGDYRPPCRERARKSRVAGDGRTYFAYFASDDICDLYDLDMRGYGMYGVVPNVRVPDFARHLIALDALEPHMYRREIHITFFQLLSGTDSAVGAAKGQERAFLKTLAADPNDTACWAAYSDWLLENDRPTLLERILKKYTPNGFDDVEKTRNPRKDRVVVQTHVAQASKHVGRRGKEDLYHHFVFFDDLWANAHPHLAAGLLRAASRWDPL
jgi:uncharacterized protein (TIGR02996 family)